MPPSPPFSQTSERANAHPRFSQKSFIKESSAFVSVMNLFKVTIIGT